MAFFLSGCSLLPRGRKSPLLRRERTKRGLLSNSSLSLQRKTWVYCGPRETRGGRMRLFPPLAPPRPRGEAGELLPKKKIRDRVIESDPRQKINTTPSVWRCLKKKKGREERRLSHLLCLLQWVRVGPEAARWLLHLSRKTAQKQPKSGEASRNPLSRGRRKEEQNPPSHRKGLDPVSCLPSRVSKLDLELTGIGLRNGGDHARE